MNIHFLVWILLSSLFFADVSLCETIENDGDPTSEEPKPTQYTAITTYAELLPERMTHHNLIYVSNQTSASYDDSGKKEDLAAGYEVNVNLMLYVVAAGITPKLNLALVVPYFNKADLEVNRSRLLSSAAYADKVSEKKNEIAQEMVNSNACADLESCLADIEDGASHSSSLPSYGYAAGDVVSDFAASSAESEMMNAGSKGDKGVGDIELGGRYQFYSNSDIGHNSAFQFGVRLPTGEYKELEVDGNIGTGSGKNTLILAYGLDQHIASGLFFAGQNTMEYDLTEGSNDNVSGSRYKGIQNKLALDLGFDCTAINPALRAIGLGAGYDINTQSESTMKISGSKSNSPSSRLDSARVKLVVDGLKQSGIPFTFEASNSVPISGKNASASEEAVFELAFFTAI